jgi:hypothetical protein
MRTLNAKVRTQLRIPAELYERIRERAHEKRQSRNQMMVDLMEEGLGKEQVA